VSGRKSRNKGARGERELVNILRDNGIEARRAGPAQRSGSANFPDVIHEGYAAEVKYRNSISLGAAIAALEQAEEYREPGVTHYAAIKITGSRLGWHVIVRVGVLIDAILSASVSGKRTYKEIVGSLGNNWFSWRVAVVDGFAILPLDDWIHIIKARG